MFKLVFAIFAAVVGFAAAKPWGGVAYASPLAYSYGSPLAYSAPVAYSGYASPVAYSAYSPYAAAPVGYGASPYSYAASPYSFYLKR
ncbi:hypothetical protein MSG28_005226 [Choristoneura fumiferana]|uniref:Uncharacterized protein n=1 Tax=Choristoneura fumiferana TaxID=7141 RepID=A0ACC0JQV0_CHOFU|nr:hypothetical protein MSG28_005226 [Choristoneura fumiferana]